MIATVMAATAPIAFMRMFTRNLHLSYWGPRVEQVRGDRGPRFSRWGSR